MTIGDRIRYFRKLRGFSQLELAELTGLHHVTIRKYEANMRTPQADHLHKVATALNINSAALIGIDENRFSLRTVGDLLGILITLCHSKVISFSGERNDDGSLRPETLRIKMSQILSSYFFAKIEGTKQAPEISIDEISVIPSFSAHLPTLLRWEKEYSQLLSIQKIALCRPTPEIVTELESCRERKELLELELQSQNEKLVWPDGLVGNLM